ncbi:WAP four-disulfide core domain protein 5-like [Amphibalanus amphitrite]|uniref:WAP four-disulfide core domain protein 5-like n=1 Tax=Amphibalanus amphitrite TaxID=1232801 RepID=UPI001C920AC6|nr:WAP four-disulfide core domain protein 5-like [Amphibalanus amphitrite]
MKFSVAVLLFAAAAAVVSAQEPPPSNCMRYCRRSRLETTWDTYCCQSSEHAGFCPPVVDGCQPGEAAKSAPRPCETDSDCAEQDKCCMDGCLNMRVCKTAMQGSPVPIVHPGRCPRLFPCLSGVKGNGQPRLCEDDGDCALRDKCCRDSCMEDMVCKTAVRDRRVMIAQ